MSNIFSKYEKAFSGVKVINSTEAYVFNPRSGKKDLPNPKYEFVGKIDIAYPNVILKMNKHNCKTEYIEDAHVLPKRVKKDLVNHFYNKMGNRSSKTKAYLVRMDTSTVKGSGIVSNKRRLNKNGKK
ncbi:MAG: hypothetical protein IJ032_02835 [Clostridia bacterium]|nr:hypothetical protein [Clostridia bacterium]